MVWIWFGLDGTGIDESPSFHWFLGPFLMVTFTFLGNTLFLTILISMLSNTFSLIVRNAVQEVQYRRAVTCYMGVKADSLFSYWPPFNILALIFLLPVKLLTGSRHFHTINVFFIRLLNVPTLLFLAWYERRTMWRHTDKRFSRPKHVDWQDPNGPRAVSTRSSAFNNLAAFWDFCRFNVHGDMQAVFDIEPSREILEQIHNDSNSNDTSRPGLSPTSNRGAASKALGQQFRPAYGSRKPSSVHSPKSRRSSTKKRTKPPRPRRQSSARLKKEFPDSESEGSSEEEDGVPVGYKRPRRGERVDSIIDFNDSNGAMQEANVRLNKMEQTLQRMEVMMMRIMEEREDAEGEGSEVGDGEGDGEGGQEGSDVSHDSVQAENELEEGFKQ
jgi:hypothetical protein